MYRAKASGRARYQVFDKSMHELALRRLDTENDLRRALANNEFLLHYQPIVSLESNTIKGFEALLRWNHPKRGFIPPKDFIRIAEETGLIIPIGAWVLAEACRQIKIWERRFPRHKGLTMSVNLSRKQFLDPDLLPEIDRILARHRIDPACLCLEITETMIMENAEVMTPTLQALRERRINLHMDDFGTGYSSLSCLHRFPINALKVDRSFISNLGSNRDYAAVVQAIVALAHNLRAQVIAEGVENEEQVVMLQTLECDFAQGYFFAKAMAPAGVEAMLAAQGVSAAA
jgi:EAL domain-containing protein (putative c-di-GMP-specific phosphodiesterase class I)